MQQNRLRELHSMKWERNSLSKQVERIQQLCYIKEFPFLNEVKYCLCRAEFLWKKLIFLTSHVNLFSSRQVVYFILEQSIITACILPLRLIVCICVQWLSTRFYEQFQIYCLSVTRNVELSGYDIFQTVR